VLIEGANIIGRPATPLSRTQTSCKPLSGEVVPWGNGNVSRHQVVARQVLAWTVPSGDALARGPAWEWGSPTTRLDQLPGSNVHNMTLVVSADKR
jgi:hypothetical protein